MALQGTGTRNLTAAATGLVVGAVGRPAITAVALGVGITIQAAERIYPNLKTAEHFTEGIVDASVALLARDVMAGLVTSGSVSGSSVRGMAGGWRDPVDMDGLIG